MIFTSSSMNVLAATIVGGYKNSNKQTEAGDDTQAETQASETQAAETNEDGSEVRQNTVTFATDGHAHIVINGATVDSTANAKDGKIVFDVVVENGYAVESVLVDKSIPARTIYLNYSGGFRQNHRFMLLRSFYRKAFCSVCFQQQPGAGMDHLS